MALSEEAVRKRLKSLEPTQESVETVSLWCLHHKDNHDLIASTWLSVFRTATEKQRVSLLYLTNDVCQKSQKKKNSDQFKESFIPRITEAIGIARHDDTIKTNLERLIKIWKERDVFDKPTLTQFKNYLNMTFDDSSSDIEEKFLLDFETSNLIRDLEKYEKFETSVERMQTLLPATNFDFKGKLKDCLKDRKEGIRIVHEVDDAYQKMSAFVSALDNQVAQHHRLIGMLEQARSFYGQQLRDATVVDDAYEKFKGGIQNVKDQLEEMQRTGVFLGASPPRDAPSPAPTDDPFAEGVEAAIVDLKRPGARDIFETSDMDIDEEPSISKSGSSVDITAASFDRNQSFFGKGGIDNMSNSPSQKVNLDPRLEKFQRVTAGSDPPAKFGGDMNHQQIPSHLSPVAPNATWNGNNPSQAQLSSPPPTRVTPAWSPVGAGPPPFPPRGARPPPHRIPHSGPMIPTYDFTVPPPRPGNPPANLTHRHGFPPAINPMPSSGPIISTEAEMVVPTSIRSDLAPPKSAFGKQVEPMLKGPGCNRRNLTVLSGGEEEPEMKYPRMNPGIGNFHNNSWS